MIITFYDTAGNNVAEIVTGEEFDPEYIIQGYLDTIDYNIADVEVEFDA